MDKRPDKSKILILGTTAAGKGTLAFELARTLAGEIISVDSMKVYRRMDIGTNKPDPRRRAQIPHHIIDIVEPSDSFSVDRFLELAESAIKNILDRQKTAIAVGGTAMYIKALLCGLFDGPGADDSIRQRLKADAEQMGLAELHKRLAAVDPTAANRIHPNDEKRIIRALEVYQLTGSPISSLQNQWSDSESADWFIIGLRHEKTVESLQINARVKDMIQKGLVDEVRALLAEEKPLSRQARTAIGYAEIIDHLQGTITLADAVEKIKINTRRLAKAQRTWFKRFANVHWLDLDENDNYQDTLNRALELLKA